MQGRFFGQGRWLAFLILAFALGARALEPAWVETPRLLLFDQFQQWKPREAGEPQVVVVEIDAASLTAVGPWPWSRKTLADMTVTLTRAGAQIVGFDTVFAEPDRFSPDVYAGVAKDLPPDVADRLAGLPGHDAYFARVLAQTRAVLGLSVGEGRKPRQSAVSLPAVSLRDSESGQHDPRRSLVSFPAISGNLPALENAAVGRGLVSLEPDLDGTIRRFPAVARVEGGSDVYPGLGLEILRVLSGGATLVARARSGEGIQDVVLPEVRVVIPTDAKGRLYPHFAPAAKDRAIPAKDVIAGSFPTAAFREKIVLISSGVAGPRATPLDPAATEAEAHAQLLESILSNTLLTRPDWADPVELGALALAGLLMIGAMGLLGLGWGMGVFALAALSFLSASWQLFAEHRLLLDGAYPTLIALAIGLTLLFAARRAGVAARRVARVAFGGSLSPEMLAQATADPRALNVSGEIRAVSVAACGLRGFAAAAERADPADLTDLLKRFLSPMTDIIQAEQGGADAHHGDAILGFWNAPLDLPDHPRAACRALLKMREAMAALNAATDHGVLRMDIGLYSGDGCVGVMGPAGRPRYSVLGEPANLAFLLQAQCEIYGVDNVTGESVREAVQDFALLELDLIQAKGHAEPLRVFTVLGDERLASDPGYQALKGHLDRMLAAYRRQRWVEAATAIAECLPFAHRFRLQPLLELYVRRIEDRRRNPPGPGWNGAHRAATK